MKNPKGPRSTLAPGQGKLTYFALNAFLLFLRVIKLDKTPTSRFLTEKFCDMATELIDSLLLRG